MKSICVVTIILVLVSGGFASQQELPGEQVYQYQTISLRRQYDRSYKIYDINNRSLLCDLGTLDSFCARDNNLIIQCSEAVSHINLDEPVCKKEIFKVFNNYLVSGVSTGANLFLLESDTVRSDYYGGFIRSAPSYLFERSTGTLLKKFAGNYTHLRFLARNILYAYRMERSAIREGIELVDCSVRPVRTIAHSENQCSLRMNDDYAVYIDQEDNQKLVFIDLALKKACRLADGCYRLDMSKDWSTVTAKRNNGPDVSYDLSSIDFN